jgi:trehalose synthase
MGKILEKYAGLASPDAIRQIRTLAKHLEGRRLLHVYSGRLNTGVKEMVDRLSGLFTEVGLQHQTSMLTGTEGFFDLVRSAEEGFDRKPKPEFLKSLTEVYLKTMAENAGRIYLSADLVVIHGVQPMGLVNHRSGRDPWVWRCHSDVSEALPGFEAFAAGFTGGYQAALFSHASFQPELAVPAFVVPPSIDPFGDANRPMAESEVRAALERLRVPVGRPIVIRFLSRGTPEEIVESIHAWEGVRGSRGRTLVLVQTGIGPIRGGASSGENGVAIGRGDDVRLVYVERGDSREMAALGWAAEAAVDTSTSPWPNLYVLDLLWKSKPVLLLEGSRTARLLRDGDAQTFRSPEEQAWRLGNLLADGESARRLGESGRARVVERFLPPRHLLDYLKLLLYFEEGA